MLREDLCPVCWEQGDESTYLFWWFTRHEENRKKTVQLDLNSLERLFMELEGREQGNLRELRYLLCLLLMRKRKLKLIKVKRGPSGEQLVLRRPRRTEELSVWVFEFTPERMEELRSKLQEVLDGVGSDEAGEEDEQVDSQVAESSVEAASDAAEDSGSTEGPTSPEAAPDSEPEDTRVEA